MDGRTQHRAPTGREWAAAQPPTNVAPLLCSMLGNRLAVVMTTAAGPIIPNPLRPGGPWVGS